MKKTKDIQKESEIHQHNIFIRKQLHKHIKEDKTQEFKGIMSYSEYETGTNLKLSYFYALC